VCSSDLGTHASDTFESGTLAGLHGGTTSIVDFAIQTRGESLESAILEWHEKADGTYVKMEGSGGPHSGH
jgi:dihydroorotase-like cyclic amidohydrolase